jgi:hypothetical protein
MHDLPATTSTDTAPPAVSAEDTAAMANKLIPAQNNVRAIVSDRSRIETAAGDLNLGELVPLAAMAIRRRPSGAGSSSVSLNGTLAAMPWRCGERWSVGGFGFCLNLPDKTPVTSTG